MMLKHRRALYSMEPAWYRSVVSTEDGGVVFVDIELESRAEVLSRSCASDSAAELRCR